jgi:hypothetical protein
MLCRIVPAHGRQVFTHTIDHRPGQIVRLWRVVRVTTDDHS